SADDVDLLHRRPAAGTQGRGHHGQMDDGVHVATGDDLGDQGVADVRPEEGDVAQIVPGWRHVDSDHGVLIILGQRAGEAGPQVSRDPSDQHDPWHGFLEAAYLPARRRWIRVRLSSLRCFFFAIRLRRFLITEPTMWDFSL